MVTLVKHGEMTDHFKNGTRVILMKGRHKDGLDHLRTFQRISSSEKMFDRAISELLALHQEGERIYVSAERRDVVRASFDLKYRMLDNDMTKPENFTNFYENLEARWVSCLMAPKNQLNKLFLFDCDSYDEYRITQMDLDRVFEIITKDMSKKERGFVENNYLHFHKYETKNGYHILTRPFNPMLLKEEVRLKLQKNPLILWAY